MPQFVHSFVRSDYRLPARRKFRAIASRLPAAAIAVIMLLAVTPTTHADIDPLSGVDLVRITAVGNAPYQAANPNDLVNGRGGVNYQYSIGRTEVPTSIWAEFFNAAMDRPADDRIPFVVAPTFWGGVADAPTSPEGQRWTVPVGNEMRPVGNITWRTAAIFCNWLHNGKATTREAFLSGAYDVGTFGFQGAIFTDQLAHSPGAKYWIPTWDEWLKAAHYDPDKLNTDGSTGGWWQYSNGSDTAYTYGPPGSGQANAGFNTPTPFSILLGSYPDVQSPWGLLDVAGGTTEWTESIRTITTGQRYRIHDGSHWDEDAFQAQLADRLREYGAEFPHIPALEYGLRIASVVPAAYTCAPVGVFLVALGARRKRPRTCTDGYWESSRR